MKLIRTYTKPFIILFLLISSFLISIHTETSKSRKFNKSLNHRITKNKSNKEDSIEKGINMFDFVLGILTCLPVIDDYVSYIEDIIDNSDKCDKSEIVIQYRLGVEQRKDANFAKTLQTLDDMDTTKLHFAWKPSEEMEEKIDTLEASNPKKACKAIVAEKERQIKENKKYLKLYEGALIAAKEIKSNNLSFENFLKHLPNPHLNFLNNKSQNHYLNLKHYFKKTIFSHLKLKSIEELKPIISNGEISWEDTIDDTIEFLRDNNKMAKLNLQELGFSGEDKHPNCSKLPSNTLLQDNKTTILDRFAGGWSAIKYIGTCILKSLPNHGKEYLKSRIIDLLAHMGLEFLKKLIAVFGSVVLNILTLFAFKALKILWWVIKAIYYLYKAIFGDETKFRYWGKAVGSGIRVIYIAFMPTERRRFKLKKF